MFWILSILAIIFYFNNLDEYFILIGILELIIVNYKYFIRKRNELIDSTKQEKYVSYISFFTTFPLLYILIYHFLGIEVLSWIGVIFGFGI